MAIEIVDFPIKNGDFPWQNVSSPEGIFHQINLILVSGVHEPFACSGTERMSGCGLWACWALAERRNGLRPRRCGARKSLLLIGIYRDLLS